MLQITNVSLLLSQYLLARLYLTKLKRATSVITPERTLSFQIHLRNIESTLNFIKILITSCKYYVIILPGNI